MKHPSAYLLVSHGSRDPRPQKAMDALASLMAARLQSFELFEPELQGRELHPVKRDRSGIAQQVIEPAIAPVPLIATAVLELHPLPLHQQIQQFAEQAIALGYGSVKILPLFLLAGVHVIDDIPAEVAIAQRSLEHRITLEQCLHVGHYPQIQQLIVNACEVPAHATKVLVAHGSRRSQGNDLVEAIAQRIGAVTAYWSREPRLETQVMMVIEAGCRDIAVLPYFLFAGGITDAIAQQVNALSIQHPAVCFYMAQPLGARPEFADQLTEVLQSELP
ncbi:MAG: sirohydrochlorin chelatase [Oculatellaceae cyanobacterium bins.114]|nr:sirohydrochlorin chelatase [Oculatellaceae cyanobacterium bins.114]